MAVKGIAVAEILAGTVLFWSGFKGQSIGITLKDLLKGEVPQSSGETPPTIGVTSSGSSDSSSTGSAIADDALKYEGHKYVWGGPSNETSGWDCSSFVSYVLGHDLGLSIPGGSWASVTSNGNSHGPVVAQYVLWSGATDVAKSDVQAGDLILYPPDTHMGIATSNTEFISAEDPASGTSVAPMSSGPGPWIARRLKAA